MNIKQQFKEGLITNNPVLVQLIGMCATMAITTSLFNGIGMGLSVLVILTCCNVVISLIRKVIPNDIRLAIFVLVIAGFVTIVDLLLQAYVPALSASLGVFIPLLIGLRMAGILPGLRSTETELPGACSLNARTRRRFAGRPLIIGLLTGVMPCGALSAMWLCAMSSGSAARGALVMLVFSLGTVPLLFLFGALQSFLPRGWMKYIVKGSAVLVVTLGLSMLVKGIRLFGM